jgi:hypothetical protein
MNIFLELPGFETKVIQSRTFYKDLMSQTNTSHRFKGRKLVEYVHPNQTTPAATDRVNRGFRKTINRSKQVLNACCTADTLLPRKIPR